jgi:hypothetical protein
VQLDHQETYGNEDQENDPHASNERANGGKTFPVFNDPGYRKADQAADQSNDAPVRKSVHSDPFPFGAGLFPAPQVSKAPKINLGLILL